MADQDAVTVKKQGGWQTSLGGAVETRVTLGTSTKGHHFAIERSYLGGDDGDLKWSRPYATEAQAERIAGIRRNLASGDREQSPREAFRERVADVARERGPLPAAQVAGSLQRAASSRHVAAHLNGGERSVSNAREAIGKSRNINQSSANSDAASYWRNTAGTVAKDKTGEAAGTGETQRRARGAGVS
jgi:hypothetical protein